MLLLLKSSNNTICSRFDADFCLYNLIEQPKLENGSTFSIDENSPSFILRYAECRHFPEDHVFYNKYGIWALVKKYLNLL